MQRWVDEADVDGFSAFPTTICLIILLDKFLTDLSYALYPGTFVDIVELLVPELQRRFVANGSI